MDPWYVYCLQSLSEDQKTYVGATTDTNRRLRQHNGELVGGARATKGRTWAIFCFVGPFEKIDALRFEWRWKFFSRKAKGSPLERRQTALNQLLELWEDKYPSVEFPQN